MKKTVLVVAGLAGILSLGSISTSYAHDDKKPKAVVKVQETHTEELPDIWSNVRAKQAELDGIIHTGKLAGVHKVAFEIRDLVVSMIDAASETSKDQVQKLSKTAGRVADVAALLDKFGDGGNGPLTRDQANRLGKLLDYIEGMFPNDELGSGLAPVGPHGGGIAEAGSEVRMELSINGDGMMTLYLLNSTNRPVAIDAMKAVVEGRVDGTQEHELSLQANDDYFSGTLSMPKEGSMHLHIHVTSGEETLAGQFVVSNKGVIGVEGGDDDHGHGHDEEESHEHSGGHHH